MLVQHLKTIHYKITFKGQIEHTFTLDREIYDNVLLEEFPCKIKDDGWLYINGCKISNNQESFGNFWRGLEYSEDFDHKEGYVDATFIIDNNGYIVCQSNIHSDIKLGVFLGKIFKKLI